MDAGIDHELPRTIITLAPGLLEQDRIKDRSNVIIDGKAYREPADSGRAADRQEHV